jgi:hypothetical protein
LALLVRILIQHALAGGEPRASPERSAIFQFLLLQQAVPAVSGELYAERSEARPSAC